MKLRRGNEEKSAEGRLVQGGQDHPEDREKHRQSNHQVSGSPEAQPFRRRRGKFYEKNDQVQEHARAHLKQDRGRPRLDKKREVQAPGSSYIVTEG